MEPLDVHQKLTDLYGDPTAPKPTLEEARAKIAALITAEIGCRSLEPVKELPEDPSRTTRTAYFIADHVRKYTIDDIALDLSANHPRRQLPLPTAICKATLLMLGVTHMEPAMRNVAQFLETAVQLAAKGDAVPIDAGRLGAQKLTEILEERHMPMTLLDADIHGLGTYEELLAHSDTYTERWHDPHFYKDYPPHQTALAFAAIHAGLEFVRNLELLRQGAKPTAALLSDIRKNQKTAAVLQHMTSFSIRHRPGFDPSTLPVPPEPEATG